MCGPGLRQLPAISSRSRRPRSSALSINGLPVAYGIARVTSNNQQVDVMVFAYEFARDKAYHFVTLAPAGQTGMFSPMLNSMRRVSATEAGQVKPRRLSVVTVARGDTVQSLAARMAYTDAPLERFLVLNGFASNTVLRVGDKVKLVTY